MARLALCVLLTGCFTTIGTGTGAGIGYAAGNTGRGAKIGAAIGFAIDLEVMEAYRKLDQLLRR
jgi:hypothetical protein